MGSISKDFKILQEAYSKKIIGEAGGTATGTANVAKMQQQAQQPAPVTSAGVAAGVSDTAPAAATPAAPAQPTKDQADFDTAVTKYFKAQGVSDADIKKFLDSTHSTLKSVAATNASAAPAGATKPWQPGFTQQGAAPQAAPAAAPSTARYMPQSNAAAYGAPGFAGRPSYASR